MTALVTNLIKTLEILSIAGLSSIWQYTLIYFFNSVADLFSSTHERLSRPFSLILLIVPSLDAMSDSLTYSLTARLESETVRDAFERNLSLIR